MPSLGDLGLNCVPFEDALANVDLALIVTAHPDAYHDLIASGPAVLDLRGVLSDVRDPPQRLMVPPTRKATKYVL